MSAALQQQVFSLDARFNAHRAPNLPSFRTLYIRRRSQLLRETERDAEKWKQYIKLRSMLLQQRYGNTNLDSSSSTTNLSRTVSRSSTSPDSRNLNVLPEGYVVPTKQAEASWALVGGTTIAENYAFVGVHHIFDQHTQAVTMVKFANNDRTRICCSSLDGNLSICDVTGSPPSVLALLKGHTKAVSGFDWSADNDLIVSASIDSSIKVWEVKSFTCLRTVVHPHNAQLLCCLFQPSNNNLLIVSFSTGNSKGELRIANVSLGRFMKNACRVGGNVLSLASDTSGRILWAGNDKGEITSVLCDVGGALCRARRITVHGPCSVTSLSYRAWISREARDPMLLVNSTNNSLSLFSVNDSEGSLRLRRRFQNHHQKHLIKSTFCPIMSFRQGACVVTGSEDGAVYFLDIEKSGCRAVVNTLQGHAHAVLGISFSYDESMLATSDLEGLVIIWKREDVS